MKQGEIDQSNSLDREIINYLYTTAQSPYHYGPSKQVYTIMNILLFNYIETFSIMIDKLSLEIDGYLTAL